MKLKIFLCSKLDGPILNSLKQTLSLRYVQTTCDIHVLHNSLIKMDSCEVNYSTKPRKSNKLNLQKHVYYSFSKLIKQPFWSKLVKYTYHKTFQYITQ